MYVCMYVCIKHVCMYVCIQHVCMYACIQHVCMYVCMYTSMDGWMDEWMDSAGFNTAKTGFKNWNYTSVTRRNMMKSRFLRTNNV